MWHALPNMFRRGDLKSIEDFFKTMRRGEIRATFYSVMQAGRLDIAKVIVHFRDIVLHERCDVFFRWACGNGNLRIAKWLLKVAPKINVRSLNDCAFRWACGNGHLQTCKWLLKIAPINVHAEGELAFLWACEEGHLKVAKWLLKIAPSIKICTDHGYAFHRAYVNGHRRLSKWLSRIHPPFNACSNNNLRFVSFFN